MRFSAPFRHLLPAFLLVAGGAQAQAPSAPEPVRDLVRLTDEPLDRLLSAACPRDAAADPTSKPFGQDRKP